MDCAAIIFSEPRYRDGGIFDSIIGRTNLRYNGHTFDVAGSLRTVKLYSENLELVTN